MTVIGEAFVAVRPDSTGFGADAEKGVLGSVSSIAKKAAVVLGGAFAASKGIDFLKSSVAEARESNKVAAQTAAVIKSTGAAANVSAKDVDALATAISRKTGIDDEQIAKASNLLLTFTGVRNEVGKGNDVFNQATKIATDMGAALGTDASGSAIQLGKALNDPIRGITALTRVGVVFDDKQRKSIETMQKSGNIMGAQKVILAELSKEFGGSAEAQATSSQKLAVAFGNIKEQVGGLLIPVIDKFASLLADKLPKAIDFVREKFSIFREVFAAAMSPDGWEAHGAIEHFAVFAAGIVKTIQHVIENVRLFVNAFRTGFTEDEGTPIERIALVLREHLLPIMQRVAAFVKDHWKPILIGLGLTIAALAAPVLTAVGVFAYLYNHFQKVRDITHATVDAIKSFIDFLDRDVRPAVEKVARTIADGFGNLVESVSKRLAPLLEAVRHVLKAIEVAVGIALAPIIIIWKLWGDQITAVVSIAFGVVRDVVEAALRVIGDVIDVVLSVINGDWGKAWDALKDIPVAVFGAIKSLVTGEIEALVTIVKSLPGKLLEMVGLMATAGSKIGGAFLDALGGAISGAKDFAADIGKSVLNAIIGFINKQVIDRVNDALDIKIKGPGWLPDIHLNPPDIPHLPKLAGGGVAIASPGGMLAQLAEAGRNELVLPLPDGLLSGLTALARAASAGSIGGGLHVTLVAPPERNAGREVIAELQAVQYLRSIGGVGAVA